MSLRVQMAYNEERARLEAADKARALDVANAQARFLALASLLRALL